MASQNIIKNANTTARVKEKSKTSSRDILQKLYDNVDMAKKAIEFVLPRVKDSSLKSTLISHYESYDDISCKITGALTSLGVTPSTVSRMSILMLRNAIKVKTAFCRDASFISAMVIKGNNTGINSINKLYNDSKDTISEEVESLLKELLSLEQKDIDDLKRYL